MNNIVVDKTYAVELLIKQSSTSQQISFPILQVLDEKLTQGLETYHPTIVTKSPGNKATANANLLAVSFLNLIVGDVQQIWNIPLTDLITTNNGATPFNPFAYELNNLPIIWSKSYVFIGDITKISGVQDEVYLFNIKYTDMPAMPTA